MTTWRWLWEMAPITIRIPRISLLLFAMALILLGLALLTRAVAGLV